MVGGGRVATTQRPRGRKSRDAAAQEALLAEVATLYYVDRFTQEEVARQIGRSVATVSRLLSRAEASEIVDVRVQSAVPVVPALQSALAERFGLRVARVARTDASEPHLVVPHVGELAARHIATIVTDGMTVVLSGGTAVREVVRAMPPAQFRELRVVQAIGSLGSQLPNFDNPLATRELASRLGGVPHLLPAPMIVESLAVREAMAEDPHFCEPLQLCRQADIAIVGIGAADPEQSIICRAGYLDRWTMEHIRAQGGVGDVMAEFFDIYGHILDTDVGSRVIGMRRDGLRAAGTVVAVAAGLTKAPAILGALRTGVIDVLATDDLTARRVLELADRYPARAEHGREFAAGPGAPSPPGEETARRTAILEATLSILERDGYQAMSIAIVAAKAGVERQLIFRWWPSKAALAIDACTHVARPPTPVPGSLGDQIAALLQAMVRPRPPGPPAPHLALRTMIAESQLDPEFRRAYLAWQLTWRGELVRLLQPGREQVTARDARDVDRLADTLLGAVWYPVLTQDAPLSDDDIHDIVTFLIGD